MESVNPRQKCHEESHFKQQINEFLKYWMELLRVGGGKRRSGATALLKSVSMFFSVTQRGRLLALENLKKDVNMKEPKGPAKVLETLRKKSHFTRQELAALDVIFQKLLQSKGQSMTKSDSLPNLTQLGAAGAKVQGLDRVVFRDILHNTFGLITEEVIMDRIFSIFDSQNDGVIHFDEWVLGMSVFLRGTLDERISFAFSIYDLNNDGFINKEEMFQLLRNCLVKQPQDEDPDESVNDLVELVLKKIDADNDRKLSFDDFHNAVRKEPLFLEAFGQCFPSHGATKAFFAILSV